MLPLKIGACLKTGEIASHREWLFGADRDIEVQDFMTHAALTGEFEARIAAAKTALAGHAGRVGIHGPYEGLDLDNKDPELRPLITARFLRALEAADRIGARQMVLHSPYTRWYKNNLLCTKGYAEAKLERIQSVLTPVVDLSRFDAAPLIAFTATKETDYGTETDGRIPPRCGAYCADQWADAQAGG